MNLTAIAAIYRFEMKRFFRTLVQSLISPVISTALYFIVFGTAIGSRLETVDGVSYGAFIVPGLIMLTVLMQSVSNASFAIYFPRFIGTFYELLSAPVSALEIVAGYVGAAATKSFIIGMVIFATAHLFVTLPVQHPVLMVAVLILTCVSFAILGFIIGIWAKNFEQLQLVPMLVLSPLVFLGGLLLDRHAARPVADDRALQPGRLSGLRFPLVVLRSGGGGDRPQPAGDRGLHGHLSRAHRLDLPHRLPGADMNDRQLRALLLINPRARHGNAVDAAVDRMLEGGMLVRTGPSRPARKLPTTSRACPLTPISW